MIFRPIRTPMRLIAEFIYTSGRFVSKVGGAITRIGDRLYNKAEGIRFRRTNWDHDNPNWSPEFYQGIGKRAWNTPRLRRVLVDFGPGKGGDL